MRWVALAFLMGLLVVGCGDTGATEDELHAAYRHGYAAGESDGRNDAEALAEEEWASGYDAGVSDGEEEALELEDELNSEFEAEENRLGDEAEEAQLEAEEEAADEAEELDDLEAEIEAEERCERYDYCYP